MTRRETDPFRDWEPRSPLARSKRLREAVRGTLIDTALDTRELLDEWAQEGWQADVVVSDILWSGVVTAAESKRIPAVALGHYPYPLPVRGAPPVGSGLRPGRTAIGRARDEVVNTMLAPFYRPMLETLNEARTQFGLAPYQRYEQWLSGTAAVLLMTEPELDFSSRAQLPPNVHYTGHAWEPPETDWRPPWPKDNRDPLVLISFSTTYMDQQDFARRVLRAVSDLPVRALLTTGPALDLAGLEIPANARVEHFVPHAAVLPHAALTVTHAGWATVQASLTAGVPLVCIPDARDQPDNAARVVEAESGVRLKRSASPAAIRRAIVATLADPVLSAGARRMAKVLNGRDGATAAVEMIEWAQQDFGTSVVPGAPSGSNRRGAPAAHGFAGLS